MTTTTNPELIVARGLPGSGKSTWAEAWRLENPGARLRSNRDDLRASMFGVHGVLSFEQEEIVTAAQHAAARKAFARGFSVVVDDTNLRVRHVRVWQELADALSVTFTVQDFPTPVEECVIRDAERGFAGGRSVGRDVITGLATRFHIKASGALPAMELNTQPATDGLYVPNPELPPAYIVDIDGTLARHTDRSPYDYTRVSEDELVENVAHTVRLLSRSNRIVIMSGRDTSCEEATRNWLMSHGIFFSTLLMRAEGDGRPDPIIKRELFDRHVRDEYNVIAVLDDRDRVVRMWRDMGLTCLQVASGTF